MRNGKVNASGDQALAMREKRRRGKISRAFWRGKKRKKKKKKEVVRYYIDGTWKNKT